MVARVFFATSKIKLDVNSAQEHGDFVYLFDRAPSPFRPDEVVSGIREQLKDSKFNPQHDLIALTGPQYLVAMLLTIAADEYRNVTMLMFDASTGRYVPRQFRL